MNQVNERKGKKPGDMKAAELTRCVGTMRNRQSCVLAMCYSSDSGISQPTQETEVLELLP